METDTFIQKVSLKPYEMVFFKENYDDGEPSTTIEVKAFGRPKMAMILNDVSDEKNFYFIQELNTKDSQTSQLNAWTRDLETKSFDVENKYLYVTMINLAGSSVDSTLTISRRL